MDIESKIKTKAVKLDFDLVGITTAEAVGDRDVLHFQQWLEAGCHGEMGYMERNMDKRTAPANLLEGAESVIVAAVNYKPPIKRIKISGRIANYALYEDYHDFIKVRLFKLAEYLNELIGKNDRFKICVDSVPLAERALAVRAGLGFIAKNHMLTSPDIGQQVFLGEIITTAKLKPDQPTPVERNCESCDKCVRACPTGALQFDGKLNASKCINYLTIEHRGQISAELACGFTDQVFGCDICVEICPYNTKAPAGKGKLKLHPERAAMDLEQILGMSEGEFEKTFSGSVILRTGYENLKRNAKVCLENLERSKEA